MVNSQLGPTVNKILALSGQGQIAQAAFGDRTQQTRFQVQTINFVDLAQRMLVTHMNTRFMQRKFYINTFAGTAGQPPTLYPLDASINAESILYHSFFCQTSGSAWRMRNWDYREFRAFYPDLTIVPKSIPRLWILNPILSTDASPTNNVFFYPDADTSYTIEYQAKLNAQPLVNYTDTILFPPEYEHVLWLQGRSFLEQALGEGKEGNIEIYCQRAIDAIQSWGSSTIEARSAVRPGLTIEGIKRGRGRRIRVYPISK